MALIIPQLVGATLFVDTSNHHCHSLLLSPSKIIKVPGLFLLVKFPHVLIPARMGPPQLLQHHGILLHCRALLRCRCCGRRCQHLAICVTSPYRFTDFPTCQVRVSNFYKGATPSLSSPPPSSSSAFFSSSSPLPAPDAVDCAWTRK